MDVCDSCGLVVVPGDDERLVLCELEDNYGVWYEWLCEDCIDVTATLVASGLFVVKRFRLYDFELRHRAC